MKHEKSCGAVVFTCGDVRQYVLVRSAKGEYWGLPKGHVEDGETEQETALREVLEETGVQARLLDGFREVIEYEIFGEIRKEVVFFAAEYDNQQPDCSLYEISGVTVLPIDEAVKLMTYDDMRQVLIKADNWLSARKEHP